MSKPPADVYHFGQCQLDVGRRELTVDGRLIELQPLAFDLLLHFVTHAGQVLRKDALLESVWRSPHVTDSVVARAVMKVRRAIGDDADHPRLLRTVHRVGYRFDATVEPRERTLLLPKASITGVDFEHAPQGLALLPFVNATGDPGLDWVEHGLLGLTHHLIEKTAQVCLVPWTDLAGLATLTRGSEDALAQVCRLIRCSEAVLCELRLHGAGYQLLALRGRARAQAVQSLFEAGDVLALANLLAQSLTLQAEVGTESTAGPQWQQQLALALDLAQRGMPAKALEMLEACTGTLPAQAPLVLAQARLLRLCGRLLEAREKAQWCMDPPAALQDASIAPQALLELAEIAFASMQLADAAQHCEMALGAAKANTALLYQVPAILNVFAKVERERAHVAASIQLAERAISGAIALRDRPAELQGRISLAGNLIYVGHLSRASEVLLKTVEQAHADELTLQEANAYRMLASVEENRHQFSLSIDYARRASALATACGSPPARDSAWIQELLSLVGAGQAAEALQRLAEFEPQMQVSLWNTQGLGIAKCRADWRLGDYDAAIESLARLVDAARQAGQQRRWLFGAELVFGLISLNRVQEAQASLSVLEGDPRPGRTARCHAALALRTGQRARCEQILRDVWKHMPMDNTSLLDVAIDLAWLLLEDGRLEELEEQLALVADHIDEYLPARILRTAFLLVRNPKALRQDEWPQVLAAGDALLRRYEWVGEARFATALRTGIARPLPELLTRACW